MFAWAKIEAITERVENIVGSGKGGSVLVRVGTNNVEREVTTAIVIFTNNRKEGSHISKLPGDGTSTETM